jgi:hypothetical protein
MMPMRGILLGGCAGPAVDRAMTAPEKVMNSRGFIASPHRSSGKRATSLISILWYGKAGRYDIHVVSTYGS